jgi:periplasmic protein TonB
VSRVGNTLAEGWAFAVLLHGALLAWLLLAPPPRQAAPRRPPVRVRLAAPPPASAPEQRPPPAAEAPAPRRVERAKPSSAAAVPPPPAVRAPPLAPSAAPPPSPVPLRRFAVSMEATVPGGGVAVPVAGPGAAPALRAVPGGTSDDPGAPVTAAEVETAPRLLSQPPAVEMRSLYPEAARREGMEADVRLEILLSETGEVADVEVVRSAGAAFDEAARRLARRFRFSPASRGGRPVAVRIPWTLKFRLED